MSRDPVLATKTLPKGDGENVARTFTVHGGLHYIKGNRAPYFSLTYAAHRKGFPNQCWSGGAGHDLILKHYPRFADLAALHLCNIDGAPSHASKNGWYDLAGALGGMGERYHVGNSERHFPIDPPADKPWQNTVSRKPTQTECLQIFARHMRISEADAAAFVESLHIPRGNVAPAYATIAKQELAVFVEAQRARWKAEAEACIAKHGLVIYGDPWPVKAEA